jgi:Gram-negative bacterial TonB protein C-terminal
VVRIEGVCSDVTVVRSLDRTFGLDDEAVRKIGEWRFRPALLGSTPVASRIMFDFDLTFALR